MNESEIIEDNEQITGEAVMADLSKWAFENMEGASHRLRLYERCLLSREMLVLNILA